VGDSNFAFGLTAFAYIVPDLKRAGKAGKLEEAPVPRQNSIHLYFQQLRPSFSQPLFFRSKKERKTDFLIGTAADYF
jgi:hypothetical protein